MAIRIERAREHNLRDISLTIGDGLTVFTGVSGSGKSSLVFDTVYHEARRRLSQAFSHRGAEELPAEVDSISGLGPAVAIGQDLLNRNPSSTVATASGVHPLLRLAFARFGSRTCPGCGAVVLVRTVEEAVASAMRMRPVDLVAPLVRRSRGSHQTLLALVQGFLAASDNRRFVQIDGQRFDRTVPSRLEPRCPHSIYLFVLRIEEGTSVAEVRRAIESAMDGGACSVLLRGATAERELTLIPVCPDCSRPLRTPQPVHFHTNCPHCAGQGCEACRGTGLHPEAAAVTLRGMTLPELLGESVDALSRSGRIEMPSDQLSDELERRINALADVGLGYLTLDRASPTLSRGEAQRLRLALTLIAPLADMIHILDEPTIGQHPADVERLVPLFSRLPGRVVCVEHDARAVRHADEVVDLGPGGGPHGGRIVYQGSPKGLWESGTESGLHFSGRAREKPTRLTGSPHGSSCEREEPADAQAAVTTSFTFDGAAKRNLASIRVQVPVGRVTCVTGVSGSGKTTLVFEVIAESVKAGEPVGCAGYSGPKCAVTEVDQGPIGRNPRSTPATYTKLADYVRDLFAEETGLSPSHFSYNRPEGACPDCQGIGAIEVKLRHLKSRWITCSTCSGRRFREEVEGEKVLLGERLMGIGEFYDLCVEEAIVLLPTIRNNSSAKKRAMTVLSSLSRVGLGYLRLGQASPSLSGGEAQRIKLARHLHRSDAKAGLILLDEPTTGLHPKDVRLLINVLRDIARRGATVLVVEHDLDVIAAADRLIDLGPGSGPDGGRLLYQGPPDAIVSVGNSTTGTALRSRDQIVPVDDSVSRPGGKPYRNATDRTDITIVGASANNLQHISVAIPRGKMTALIGPSGSGKSSLLRDVLEAEARNRYLSSLSMYERQNAGSAASVEVERIDNLGLTATLRPSRAMHNPRSTVGLAGEILPHVQIVMSRRGRMRCPECGVVMDRINSDAFVCSACGLHEPAPQPRHFSSRTYSAACTTCSGVGSLQYPNPRKLIRHPDLPLCDGAMYSPGFFPGGYLCKPGNHGHDTLSALADRYGFDPQNTPWREMSESARQAFLFGDEQELTVHFRSKSGRTGTKTTTFPGFYGWLGDWDTSGTYSDTAQCPDCRGSGLREPFRSVDFAGWTMPDISSKPLSELLAHLKAEDEPKQPARDNDHLRLATERVSFLVAVGLGYLHLGRRTSTLSAGEAQRVRLASLLAGDLTDLTVLLDEPTRGMHPREVSVLSEVLHSLRDSGNTVIVVEHDAGVIDRADHVIALGPGSGTNGGSVVYSGPPSNRPSSDEWSNRPAALSPSASRAPEDGIHDGSAVRSHSRVMTVFDATAHYLRIPRLDIPLGRLVGVCGVSGSGKSTLVVDTIGRAVAPRTHTTSVATEPVDPGTHRCIEGAPERALVVDQGRGGMSSAADYVGLPKALAKLYAADEAAEDLGLGADEILRRCPECGGRGSIRTDLGFLAAVEESCDVCAGTGSTLESERLIVRGLSFSAALSSTVDDVMEIWHDEPSVSRRLSVLQEVGLGYLVLNQLGATLSGGEIQRLKIAKEIKKRHTSGSLFILDEPTVGQSRREVTILASVLRRITAGGSTVLVLEHDADLLVRCDWLIELGPAGGPQGGRVIAEGPVAAVAEAPTPTAPYLRAALERSR